MTTFNPTRRKLLKASAAAGGAVAAGPLLPEAEAQAVAQTAKPGAPATMNALCKEHGTSLLLSATTAKALPEAQLVAVGDIAVRGFAEPVTVFSIPADT
jgi:hypothetical protein